MVSYTLPKSAGGYNIIGRSKAADATCITIPSLSWNLDCGAIVQNWRPEHVFITHTHSDHSNRVTHVVSRHKPPTIYVPKFAVELVDGYLNAHQAMTDNRPLSEVLESMKKGPPDWQINRIIKPVIPGDIIDITKGGKDWKIEIVACNHTVPCVGYAFREKKKVLKEEYKGKQGKELGLLRKQGIIIHEEVMINRFVFMGDTTADIFNESPFLLNFPVVITECSFLSDEHSQTAKSRGHTHWNDLKPFVINNPNTQFILIHFSLRYNNQDIISFFNKENCSNVIPFIDTTQKDHEIYTD